MLYTTAIVYLINQIKFNEHFQFFFFHYLIGIEKKACKYDICSESIATD